MVGEIQPANHRHWAGGRRVPRKRARVQTLDCWPARCAARAGYMVGRRHGRRSDSPVGTGTRYSPLERGTPMRLPPTAGSRLTEKAHGTSRPGCGFCLSVGYHPCNNNERKTMNEKKSSLTTQAQRQPGSAGCAQGEHPNANDVGTHDAGAVRSSAWLGGLPFNITITPMPGTEHIVPPIDPDGHECGAACLEGLQSLLSALDHSPLPVQLTGQQVAVLARHYRDTRNGLPREFLDWARQGELSSRPAPLYQLHSFGAPVLRWYPPKTEAEARREGGVESKKADTEPLPPAQS